MVTSFDVGGSERQTVELVRRLDPSRFRVHLACFRTGGPLQPLVPDAVPIARFPVRGFGRMGSARQWIRFARWCRDIEARLVHTCDLYANIFGLTAAALAGVPARIGSRREILTGDKTPVQLAAQRAAYRRAHAVLANSEAAARQLAHEGVDTARIRVIPNGVDLERVPPRRTRDIIRRIVTVANLRPEKGHDVLIDAAPSILAAYGDAEFHIAGDGPCADALAARARERGVAGRVHMLGHCDRIPDLLAGQDLFVLPSRSEALPNAVIEAMAAGLPVVASRVGGIPELIDDRRTGRLVPPGDAAALAAAIVELMNEPTHAAALGRAGQRRAQERYAFPRMVGRVEDLYLTEIARRAPRVSPAADPVAPSVTGP